MSSKKCESCGQIIENPSHRQRFCAECIKRRKLESSRRHYKTHREYYAAQSQKRAHRLKQIRVEELHKMELKSNGTPQYTIEQVNQKAMDSGISYGRCSYLLSTGKISME